MLYPIDYQSKTLIKLFGRNQIVERKEFFKDEKENGIPGVFFLGLTKLPNSRKKGNDDIVFSILVWFPTYNQGDIYLDIIPREIRKKYKNKLDYIDLIANYGKLHKGYLSFDEVIDIIKKQDPYIWYSNFDDTENEEEVLQGPPEYLHRQKYDERRRSNKYSNNMVLFEY